MWLAVAILSNFLNVDILACSEELLFN